MGIGMNSNRFASPAPKNSNGANLDGSVSFSNASYADWRTMDGPCESSSNMILCPVAGLGHANGNDSRSSAAVLCANNSSPLFTQIRACRAALEARVAEQMIPTGLGSLTLALLDGQAL